MTGPAARPTQHAAGGAVRSSPRWALCAVAILAAGALLACALALLLEPGFVGRHLSHDGQLGAETTRWLLLYRRLAAAAAALLLALALAVLRFRRALEPRLAAVLPRLLLLSGGLLAALLLGELLVRSLGEGGAGSNSRLYEQHLVAFWRAIRPQLGQQTLRGWPLERERPPGVVRVLVLGDSFVFGVGVDALEDTYPAALERELEAVLGAGRVQVLNGGHPGADTVAEIATARALLPRLLPDLVVLGYHLNDVESQAAKQRYYARRHLLPLVSDNLARHSRLWALIEPRLVAWLRGAPPAYREHLAALHEQEQARHRGELAELAHVVAATGAPLAAVVFPLVSGRFENPPPGVHERLAVVFRELSVPCLDLLTVFRGMDSDELAVAPHDRHLDAGAQALAARATADFLRANGLLPAPR